MGQFSDSSSWRQVEDFRRKFAPGDGLPFSEVLSQKRIEEVWETCYWCWRSAYSIRSWPGRHSSAGEPVSCPSRSSGALCWPRAW
jgi:hypothetical protein